MGLERVAAVVQGQLSNYDTDLFTPLLQAVGRRAGKAYGKDAEDDVSMRVVADHLRATTFLVSDGVLPGNEGRGYVLRKIMRRAMRHGKKLGVEGPFLSELTGDVVARMKAAYPELAPHAETIARVVSVEEERFGTTLKQAFAIFEEIARSLPAGAALPGTEVFRLYDTYGLPLDFTEELARDRGLRVDAAGFERELAAQQERARQSSKMGAVKGDPRLHEARRGGREDRLRGLHGARRGGRPRPRRPEGRRPREAPRGAARRGSSSSTARPSTRCRAARWATGG